MFFLPLVGSYMMYYKHTATELRSEDHLVTSPVIINGKDTSHTCLTMAYYLNGSTNTANIKVALELLSGHKATEITIHAAKAARRKWTRVSVDIQFITNPFRVRIIFLCTVKTFYMEKFPSLMMKILLNCNFGVFRGGFYKNEKPC